MTTRFEKNIVVILGLLQSSVVFASQPCPDGTRPNGWYTFSPALFFVALVILFCWVIHKKVKSLIFKISLMIIVTSISLFVAFMAFGFANMIAPCV